ncbi:hypothetical protein QAD02_001128 [Eretmocerus hayati]|uniref:Uncharacterized protein n=1 Tax=Eretmocerus hayati TaxID=131215 RepID=A0ACC2NFK5_9HYME|nr:hypothetical protein QAD02_001128 [Eretmocerus hayati]
MSRRSIIYHSSMLLLAFGCSLHEAVDLFDDGRIEYMSREERDTLKQESRDMFYHAYQAYMNHAYPADELMPLSCKGRFRGSEPDRGDIDSTLGNFSLTLVDTLDTLVVMGDIGEFEKAVKLVIRDVTFDTDVIVSLFETNIRMLGGLLSAHVLADHIKVRGNAMPWYKDELLHLAKDLGYRFLPAFNTSTGIPFGRVNLRYGMKGVPSEMMRETCTACAGSMILEMAALSRLTGESIFEDKAQKAMDVLWKLRHRGTDLMGSVLNVNSGDWVRRDSGVGAGIDSYYEYCLKAYILLGDEKYLGRFNKHYHAIMKYISQGPMLLDVHMHRPNTNSRNFMDALLAFWPGLQVLKGDIKPAVETHEMLYQVMQRHNFIPEAFTTDFQVHWGHHPLRPEFLESTYFLYKATADHYYLGVGRKVLKSLQTYARVPCGFAAVSDVRTNKHDDTMDSFVLSETFKYLFLLFADPSDLLLNLDEYVFTTEGHLLPLFLASVKPNTTLALEREKMHVEETDRTCPNSVHLFPASVRQPLRNMVEDVCPKRSGTRRLIASQFQPSNAEHARLLSDMGIAILTLSDGSVQLLHTYSNARTPQDADEGLLFMQEMVELSKIQNRQQQQETNPVVVSFIKPNSNPFQKVTLLGGPAQFGKNLKNEKLTGNVVLANPPSGCSEIINANALKGMIGIVDRGSCMFVDKARRLQAAGAIGGIVLDNVPSSSLQNSPMFAMSGDGKGDDDVNIPLVFLFSVEASQLLQAIVSAQGPLTVTIGSTITKEKNQLKAPTDVSMLERIKGTLKEILSRQLTSQNLPATASVNDVADAKSSAPDPEHLSHAHLRAFVMGDSSGHLIKININLDSQQANFEDSKNVHSGEESWMLMKRLIVNELFGTIKFNLGFVMRSEGLSKIHSLIMSKRGVSEETLADVSMAKKIMWFLKELGEVKPDPLIVSLYMDMHPEIEKQYFLSYLFRLVAFYVKNHLVVRFSEKISISDTSLVQSVAVDVVAQLEFVPSIEYNVFMTKYLPLAIRYIINESSNTTSDKDKEHGADLFSVTEFIKANQEHIVNTDPAKIFKDHQLTSSKDSSENSRRNVSGIRIDSASPQHLNDEQGSITNVKVNDSKDDAFIKLQDSRDALQSAPEKTKGEKNDDETSHSMKGSPLKDTSDHVLISKHKHYEPHQETVSMSAPVTRFDDKQTDSETDKTVDSMKKTSRGPRKESSNRSVGSSKREGKHVHDDL